MKYEFTLSIGYPTAHRTAVIEIDDDELQDCLSSDEREELIHEYLNEWAWNYIDTGYRKLD